MLSPEKLALALTEAGVDKLSPRQRAYLAERLIAQPEPSEHNLGGLRDWSFGASAKGTVFADFPDIGASARALVAASFRAAPRDWARTSKEEVARLGGYPFSLEKAKFAKPPLGFAEDATVVTLGWWPGFGPSDEAQKTFQGLVADWEAFDRMGVGAAILPELREDVADWRKFRDAWKNADIDSSDIGGRLTAQVIAANRVRMRLADLGIKDPALLGPGVSPVTGFRQGVDVDNATGASIAAQKVEQAAKSSPVIDFLTSPSQNATSLFGLPAIPNRILWAAGGGVAGIAALALLFRRGSPKIVVAPVPVIPAGGP